MNPGVYVIKYNGIWVPIIRAVEAADKLPFSVAGSSDRQGRDRRKYDKQGTEKGEGIREDRRDACSRRTASGVSFFTIYRMAE